MTASYSGLWTLWIKTISICLVAWPSNTIYFVSLPQGFIVFIKLKCLCCINTEALSAVGWFHVHQLNTAISHAPEVSAS